MKLNDDGWGYLAQIGDPPAGNVIQLSDHIGMDDRPSVPVSAYADELASTQFVELSEAERAAIPAALFTPWVEMDLAAIPYPHFVYSDFYARGYTSVTLAPPKVGKSMLGLAEAIDIATGRGILTGVRRDPQRVVYYNAEDDQDVINSRVAALLTCYDIPQSEIAGRLFATSGVNAQGFYMASGQEGVINEPLFVSIERFIKEAGADALIFDPLQDLTRSPETNEVFRILGQRLRRLASQSNVALGLIHHTRKIAPGSTPSIDDGRGGSALRGTARFNRLLIGMTEDEAVKANVMNHRHFMRIGDMESNLAPPSAELNRWFEKVSIVTPNGHSVGAIKRWEWPDAFDGVTSKDLLSVQNEIHKRCVAGNPPRFSDQTGDWVGHIVAEFLALDAVDDRARIKRLLTDWLKSGALQKGEFIDHKREKRPTVVVGEWASV